MSKDNPYTDTGKPQITQEGFLHKAWEEGDANGYAKGFAKGYAKAWDDSDEKRKESIEHKWDLGFSCGKAEQDELVNELVEAVDFALKVFQPTVSYAEVEGIKRLRTALAKAKGE